MSKTWEQIFDEVDYNEDYDLPELKDRWAVVISPSTSWSNYRHQADAFAIYQGLKDFGYADGRLAVRVFEGRRPR